MAIPKFASWHNRNFRNTISRKPPEDLAVLTLDLNQIIHDSAGKYLKEVVKKEGEDQYSQALEKTFEDIFNTILNLVIEVNPSTVLYIAVDGVAPFAKINQQRNRRYKSALNKKPDAIFDSNAISPGTEFMFLLDAFLRKKLAANKHQLPQRVIYSSHLIRGEGEHKIAEYLRAHEKEFKDKGVMVDGSDSDLFMIYSLLIEKGWSRIHLRRRREKPTGEVYYEYVSLKTFCDQIIQMYQTPKAISDFVVILFLNGNDFLPRFPMLQDTSEALSLLVLEGYPAYLTQSLNQGGAIFNEEGIVWKNLGAFISYITKMYESKLLEHWVNHPNIKKTDIPNFCTTTSSVFTDTEKRCETLFDYQKFKELWYPYIFSKNSPYRINPTSQDIERMLLNYCEGITWIYDYYSEGESSINLTWHYAYHYPPLLSDLPLILNTEVRGVPPWQFKPRVRMAPLDVFTMMVLIMPPLSIELVIPELRLLYLDESPIYDLMPHKFRIETGFIDEFQHEAVLPIPNPSRAAAAIRALELPEELTEKYKTGDLYTSVSISREPIKATLPAPSESTSHKKKRILNRRVYTITGLTRVEILSS